MRQDEYNLWKKLLIGGSACFVAVVLIIIISFYIGNPTNQESTSVKKEFAEYSEELVSRAKSGDAEAQYSLGNCYFYGFGIAKDQREAVKWLRKSAEQGYTPAQNDLGHCYYSGAGVERNQEEAERWWKKAAEGK